MRQLIRLGKVAPGTSVRVMELTAEGGMCCRLRELGFREQQTIRLVSSQASVICLVCNSRLAISVPLANTILVEPVSRVA